MHGPSPGGEERRQNLPGAIGPRRLTEPQSYLPVNCPGPFSTPSFGGVPFRGNDLKGGGQGGHHPLQSLSNALVTAETHCVATPQSPLF